ncbi:MAG: hypothetical protein ABI895_13530 [Deltaproteobacteria bacterium]
MPVQTSCAVAPVGSGLAGKGPAGQAPLGADGIPASAGPAAPLGPPLSAGLASPTTLSMPSELAPPAGLEAALGGAAEPGVLVPEAPALLAVALLSPALPAAGCNGFSA